MKLKFNSKIIALFLVFEILISSIITVLNLYSIDTMFKKEMQVLGFTLANNINDKLTMGRSMEQKLDQVLKEFTPEVILKEAEGESDVIYALMINTEGIAYAGTKEMLTDKPYTDAVTMNAIKKGISGSAFWEDKQKGIRAYDIQVPYIVDNEIKGSICIGVSMERLDGMRKESMMKSLLFTSIMCVLGVLFFSAVIKFLLSPLRQLSLQLQDISKGDFTIEQDTRVLQNKDEIGIIARAVNQMRVELIQLMNSVRSDALQLNVSSENLSGIMKETTVALDDNARAIEALANSSNEQSLEVSKVTESVVSLAEKMEQGRIKLMQASEQVGVVSSLSDSGMEMIGKLEKVTRESVEHTNAVSSGVVQIDETVHHMKSLTGQIRAISSQTNLLALNSSIEAARAGEAGKGFAVVAEQIRKLAAETSLTTEKVESVIGEVSNKTAQASEQIVEINEVNKKQTETLQKTLSVFGQIQESVANLLDFMTTVVEVNESIGESKDVIQQAIEELAGLTEMLASTCEEISASTEEQLAMVQEVNSLSGGNSKLANTLTQSIGRFKTS